MNEIHVIYYGDKPIGVARPEIGHQIFMDFGLAKRAMISVNQRHGNFIDNSELNIRTCTVGESFTYKQYMEELNPPRWKKQTKGEEE